MEQVMAVSQNNNKFDQLVKVNRSRTTKIEDLSVEKNFKTYYHIVFTMHDDYIDNIKISPARSNPVKQVMAVSHKQ